MRLTGIGQSALLVAAIAFATPGAALAQKQTENVDKTVPFPSGGTLKIRNFSGAVHITGTTGRDVVIKAVRRAEREQLDHIKLTVETSGSTITIDANKRDANWDERKENVVDTTFEIQVPASATLDVKVFSSDLDVKEITGAQTLETFSGGIMVTGIKNSMHAKTFSGTVELDAVAAGASPDLAAETFSGRIRARLADSAKGEVRFDSFSGSFDTDLPLAVRSTNRRRVSGDLPGGAGSHTLSFHTFSGDVRISK